MNQVPVASPNDYPWACKKCFKTAGLNQHRHVVQVGARDCAVGNLKTTQYADRTCQFQVHKVYQRNVKTSTKDSDGLIVDKTSHLTQNSSKCKKVEKTPLSSLWEINTSDVNTSDTQSQRHKLETRTNTTGQKRQPQSRGTPFWL